MTEYYFCTYFDRNYCAKGLALYRSLEKHIQSFRIYVLCLDDETYYKLNCLNLRSAELIQLKELESRDPAFYLTKDTRSLIEYYFTSTPAFIVDILNQHPDIDIITYLDADMYLFGSIKPAYDEMGENSILIIEHHFPENLRDLEKWGRFNVGYLSFRRDEEGMRCLNWWRERCIEWCYQRLEGDRYADQKYLDSWPTLFSDLTILKHKGINVAVWNVLSYSFRRDVCGQYVVDDDLLLVYHFHGLKKEFQLSNIIFYYMNLDVYLRIANCNIKSIEGVKVLKELYREYIFELDNCRRMLDALSGPNLFQEGSIRDEESKTDTNNSTVFQTLRQIPGNMLLFAKKIQHHDMVVVSGFRKK
jgi:hypothetical protein